MTLQGQFHHNLLNCNRIEGNGPVLVLVPGWATDQRIFERLELPSNYIFAPKAGPFEFKPALKKELDRRSIGKISFFGYSLGGFLAYEFALEYPEMIDTLIFSSIRARYPQQTLDEVAKKLKEDKNAYLREFYAACFSPQEKESRAWFIKNLLKDYLVNMRLEELLKGLDYLRQAEIHPEKLKNFKKIKIIHGKEDKIAPFMEVDNFRNQLAHAEFDFMDRRGHMPFLNG